MNEFRHGTGLARFRALHRSGGDTRLWVCSAGCGLIPADARIMRYYATLTRLVRFPAPRLPGGRCSANGMALHRRIRVASARSWLRIRPPLS